LSLFFSYCASPDDSAESRILLNPLILREGRIISDPSPGRKYDVVTMGITLFGSIQPGLRTRTVKDNTNNGNHGLDQEVLDGDLFLKMPSAYYRYALQWCVYSKWTVAETANLLTGCVPHRPMFLRGEDHKALDDEVLVNENKVRLALNNELETSRSKKYFAETYIRTINILPWARKTGIAVPLQLMSAARQVQQEADSVSYTTPMLEACDWVVASYWQAGDLREPPSEGEIIQAVLQQFPDLTGPESEMVETVCRHPYAKLP